jgi:hypothetical protein
VSERKALHAVAVLCMPLLAGSVHAATMDDELLVDPTVPLAIAVAPQARSESSGSLFGFPNTVAGNYELKSVLVRPSGSFAVINDQRVRVGDSVGAARVTRIESDHVMLNVNGRIERLELYGNSIKTLVKGDE